MRPRRGFTQIQSGVSLDDGSAAMDLVERSQDSAPVRRRTEAESPSERTRRDSKLHLIGRLGFRCVLLLQRVAGSRRDDS